MSETMMPDLLRNGHLTTGVKGLKLSTLQLVQTTTSGPLCYHLLVRYINHIHMINIEKDSTRIVLTKFRNR